MLNKKVPQLQLATLVRIAEALELIGHLLDPEKQERRVEEKRQLAGHDRWCVAKERYPSWRTAFRRVYSQLIAEYGDPHQRILTGLRRLFDGYIYCNTPDPRTPETGAIDWAATAEVLERDDFYEKYCTQFEQAVPAWRLPETLCGPKTKTAALYREWLTTKKEKS
jgi:hypothetical protein